MSSEHEGTQWIYDIQWDCSRVNPDFHNYIRLLLELGPESNLVEWVVNMTRNVLLCPFIQAAISHPGDFFNVSLASFFVAARFPLRRVYASPVEHSMCMQVIIIQFLIELFCDKWQEQDNNPVWESVLLALKYWEYFEHLFWIVICIYMIFKFACALTSVRTAD